MSGLDYVRGIFDGKITPPPMSLLMGFRGVEAEEGRAVFEGEVGEYLYNPIGVIHGGFAMTILDSALGCSVQTTLVAGDWYTTLETKTNFVRPITLQTGTVRCEARVLSRGRTIATSQAELVDAHTGKLLAHGTSTCLIQRS
jgi:uncharacterized protein (TIGR00369 family)